MTAEDFYNLHRHAGLVIYRIFLSSPDTLPAINTRTSNVMYYTGNHIVKKINLTLLGFIFFFFGTSQCPQSEVIKKKILLLIADTSLSTEEKLKPLYELKKEADDCAIQHDSVYANLFTKIGVGEFSKGNYAKSIAFTTEAIQINSLPQKSSSFRSTIKGYMNLGYYYMRDMQYNKALISCDSVVSRAKKFLDSAKMIEAKVLKAHLYYLLGDYQECIEESTRGIALAQQKRDTAHYVEFLTQRGQSYASQGKLQESFADAAPMLTNAKDAFDSAAVFKMKAVVYEKNKLYDQAKDNFLKAVNLMIRSKNYGQATNDYIDLGNFFFNQRKFEKAIESYNYAIKFTLKNKDTLKLASTYTNFENLYLERKNYKMAELYCLKAFKVLKIVTGANILMNPPASVLATIDNTDLVTELLSNKVSLLLKLYKQTNDKKYVTAAIKTAAVTDSVFTQKRHSQLGEQSKLYWRDRTRNFFQDAMEACFLANDAASAFYFMEKSRSVLLNDKLNELGASAVLSPEDAQKEQGLKIKVQHDQQELNKLPVKTAAYNQQQQIFLQSNEDLQNFIQSLETKYPAYYSYKYSDKIPKLEDLQQHLLVNKASFVYYFTTDTTAYILSITGTGSKISRLNNNEFSYDQVNEFLGFCANRDWLLKTANYKVFAGLSNKLYKTLFQPLALSKGRVIICSDNFLLPFEALCSDSTGKNFLINDYIFSYTYSATYLLKAAAPSLPKGNFIGFAPVSFETSLGVSPLKNSKDALEKAARHYNNSTLLFTDANATKNNFLQNAGEYIVANIFSHASGSNDDSEPKLYMGDSLIYLSQLQFSTHPATRLIILSACQTNVGKYATGEGIYSLARGFASAGIPSVSATLWEADEDMIYKISIQFNDYLAHGMSKDSALHQAKLDFIKANLNSERSSPYYWSNIILIGNTDSLALSASKNKHWWVPTGIALAVISIVVVASTVRKRQAKLD